MRRLLLIPHAPTSATRSSAFPAGESLDHRGRNDARALTSRLPRHCEILSSPAPCCLQTAEAAGFREPRVQTELADWDLGSWAGKTLEQVSAEDPEAVAAWVSDPAARPHGGDSVAAFVEHVGGWLTGQAELDGAAAVITHAGVVKAAIVHVLDAPLSAFWRVDAAPLSITELHSRNGRWTLTRANAA